MPGRIKYQHRVSFTFQLEKATLDKLRQEAAKRHISVSDLLNKKLKDLLSHLLSLVKK